MLLRRLAVLLCLRLAALSILILTRHNFQVASNDRGYLKRIIANAAGFAAVAEP